MRLVLRLLENCRFLSSVKSSYVFPFILRLCEILSWSLYTGQFTAGESYNETSIFIYGKVHFLFVLFFWSVLLYTLKRGEDYERRHIGKEMISIILKDKHFWPPIIIKIYWEVERMSHLLRHEAFWLLFPRKYVWQFSFSLIFVWWQLVILRIFFHVSDNKNTSL